MTAQVTARDALSCDILPLIADYLKAHSATAVFAKYRQLGLFTARLEDWILHELSVIIRKIYIWPQRLRPGFQIPPRCRISKRKLLLMQGLSLAYVTWFYEKGWLVKDATRVTCLSGDFRRELDEMAASLASCCVL
jgi:hypothetical protein